jgi:hypothetical protein
MNFISIFLITVFMHVAEITAQHAVTFSWKGGRFGDHLKCFASALWFSQKHSIPFLYPYFPLSQHLALTDLEQYNPEKHHFDQVIQYSNQVESLLQNDTESILIVMKIKKRPKTSFNDQEFRNSMKKLITPKISLNKIKLPKQYLSVAIHVRTGGSFVTDKEKRLTQPLRFAPLSYYVDQINYIRSLYPEKQLYVHLFTDDENPKHIIQFLQEQCSDKAILYGFRLDNHQQDQSVLEDFFNMMDFDILIQPKSGFSTMAAYLGHQTLLIKPTKHKHIDPATWYITEVEITRKNNGKIIEKERITY